ncbi:Exodeoxyribonuclease I subunit D [Streptoalloteichus tenebrarius]|uniref:Nuclease SbcCD subunit D n=1 Tax=Streptoalloteichus tenebrarius (strain ATCC 17920 / DSM 40477 / JCM 4838 / CBS 697.72 / NBRC 16177 / NCIMB 11028 / NRRL B-12390 / A12253. 1 / ISP 5477) TaxID=1933 RepID=A0ABT1HTR1_STRSD|nr:exonuclease SbcCD subunit D [Streptoalloteichus tenebrarius]MCP2258913.1 Exodeoxyribonuclease I subunit D [Streptoalloteichus tenebrarius]BFF01120.1 exonuclease SbcCD subunit D [Streptoalloteichus tenebrarius]
MRLLHTSDWHVGRTFHGRDLLREQEEVLTHLAELVAAERVDVVVVAGDLYDRAVPSGEAVQTCHRVLRAISEAGARIVVTPGNHDSAPRLGAYAEFAAAGGLHLRTRISGLAEPVVLTDEHGPVAIYGIPYLEPDPARQQLGVEERGHAAVLGEAMRRVRADLATRRGARSVVLAHAFVTGGAASDSERTISVGGVEHVPGSVFDGIDYVALGHLHGPQVLADHLRYSGSPLAYSFSEASHRKSVWLVDLDARGLAEVRRHELPVPRRLATVSGRLEELLTDPRHAELADHFLSVVLTDPVRPLDAMRRLQERFPHAVHLEWHPEGGREALRLRYAQVVRDRDDHEIACHFVEDCRDSRPTESERALLKEALAAVRRAEVQR